ncbi:MAG: universal stress protein [Gammaproteobacteria bacterium]|jgi:universal stress protein E|nr:universal stress protein [Gammaproteobacteria bacterium]
MQPVRRILVAVKNLQGEASPAVVKAGQLAQALGASIELFHAIVTPLYFDAYTNGSLADLEREIQQRCLAQLQAMAKSLQRRAIAVSVSASWDFPGYEAVIRHAKQMKADLIVADLHAGTHLAAGMLHLTDWELLRLSATPVLLVKTKAPYKQPVVLAAVDPTHTRAKPAALDNEILSAATSITDALHGTLHAVHAYMAAPPSIWPANMAGARSLPRLMAQTARNARKILDGALESTEIPRGRRHLVDQHPINAIEQTARRIHGSIVVMGAVSRSGLKGLFIGNTAERVLDSLTCDVLVVKPADFKQRVPRAVRGAKLLAAASTAFP